MGQNIIIPNNSNSAPLTTYRWFKCISQNKENNISDPILEPFPIDQSLQIEYNYQQKQFYEKDDLMVIFENNNHNHNILINKTNPWEQIQIRRFETNENLKIFRTERKQIFQSERISYSAYNDFSEAYGNKMSYAFYSKIFKDFKQEPKDNFMNQFFRYSTVMDQSLYEFLLGDYSRNILIMYNLKEKRFTFNVLKDILLNDFTKVKELHIYITYLIENLTPENFHTVIITCFNEEGALYKTMLNLIKTKTIFFSHIYLMYYLCLLYTMNEFNKSNSIKPCKVFFDASLCQNELEQQLQHSYYLTNDMYLISDLLITSKTPILSTQIQIEIDLETESDTYPFLQLNPFDVSEFSLYNEKDIIIRQDSVLKCIKIAKTASKTIIKFKLIENILSHIMNSLKIQKKKEYGIHEDVFFLSKEEMSTVAHARVKQKKLAFLKNKFSQCQGLNFYDNQIGDDGMSIVSNCFSSMPKLKWLNLTGCDLGLGGIQALSFNAEHLKNVSYLNLSFNMICDNSIVFINFAHFISLKFLILKVNNITEKGMVYLSSQMKHLTQLIELNLYDNQIGNEGLISFCNQFHLLNHIQKLDLYNCNADDEGFQLFFQQWNKLSSSLTNLFIKNNSFGGETSVTDLLLSTISEMKRLECLNISQNNIPDDVFKTLIEIVKSDLNLDYNECTSEFNTQTVIVKKGKNYFDGNQLKSVNYCNQLNISILTTPDDSSLLNIDESSSLNNHVIKYIKIIKSNDALSNHIKRKEENSISLSNSNKLKRNNCIQNSFYKKSIISKLNKAVLNIDDFSFDHFIKNAKELTLLNQLSFSEYQFSIKSSKQLSSVYIMISNISILNLSCCNLNSQLLFILLFNADLLVNLTDLDLSSNYFGEEGMKILSSYANQLTTLESLSLCWNYIDNRALIAFSPCLCYLINIKKLNLYGNKIQDEGLIQLSDVLILLLKLEYLNLGNNTIGDNGVKSFIQCISSLTNLSYLYLNDNLIGNDSIKVFFSFFISLSKFKLFDLSNNCFTEVALEYIVNQGIPFSFKI